MNTFGCHITFLVMEEVSGRARAVVVSVGINTEIGKIATSLETEKKVETPLQKKIDDLSKITATIGMVVENENEDLETYEKAFKEKYPNKTIWCYTGFVFDEKSGDLCAKDKNTEVTKELIALFDVLIDGPYIEEKKDIRLKFRGSSNQRVIDVQKTLKSKNCELYLD